ncbi:MAG: glutamate-5-semialdehyde dehydrogenase [Rhodospirillaceae bacterium]|nr:glutamate-5-semialdehyde dehydrogenase [Rhodospirillaceae bacterium]
MTVSENHSSDNEIDNIMEGLGKAAISASKKLALTSSVVKVNSILLIAKKLITNTKNLIIENAKDLENASRNGLSVALVDRLTLDKARIQGMADSLIEIATLSDPVGQVIDSWKRPNGLKIERVRMPLGVIGVIYESRPNVTSDAGLLCLMSGNACILRGGSESFHSCQAILSIMHEGLVESGLPASCIQMVPTKERAAVGKMLTMTEYIDVIVPRGGQSLTRRVMSESRIPTFQHLVGLCHLYVHKLADVKKARSICLNAKMRRPGICGAVETILVDQEITKTVLPLIIEDLLASGCEVRGDKIVQGTNAAVKEAVEDDWETEYLDAIVAIKVVSGLDDALLHIERYGSEHTDAIVTEDKNAAEYFMDRVCSAIVMHNASTQFADGGEFGMGAEIGIATGKMHARGPVGVEQLTTFKYKVHGHGNVRP